MSRYKIRYNEPDPGPEKIGQHQNFNKVLGDYQRLTAPYYRKPFYKNPKSFLVLVAILAVAYLVSLSVEQEDRQEKLQNHQEMNVSAEPEAGKKFFSGINIPAEEFRFDAAAGGDFTMKSGIKLGVPASAFTDGEGRKASGEILLRAIELQDAAAYFAFRQPTLAGSADAAEAISASLMLDLKAYSGDQPLSLTEGASIRIKLPAAYLQMTGAQPYLYHAASGKPYLTAQGRMDWRIQETQAVEPEQNELPSFDDLPEIRKPNLIYPRPAEPGAYHFNIKIDTQEFPEMKPFRNMIWEYAGNSPETDPAQNEWALKEEWENVHLQKINDEESRFRITFSKPGKAFSTEVYPVFEGEALSHAREVYDQKMKEYEDALAAREEMKLQILAEHQQANQAGDVTDQALRVFHARGMGTWVLGKNAAIGQGETTGFAIKDGEGNAIAFYDAYLAFPQEKILLPLGNSRKGEYTTTWYFGGQAVFWGVTEKGELVTIPANELQGDIPVTPRKTDFHSLQELKQAVFFEIPI